MRTTLAIMSALILCGASAAAQPRTTLDIYVTDVEGGNGTLFVTPAGESVLIDTGNAKCPNFQHIENNVEGPMSVASYIIFGMFRTAHLGDLPRKMEFKMMCPNTSLPPVDVFLGLHHGVESSNSPVMVHALRPRVAIINNGTRKGGDPTTMKTVRTSPGLEDLWQIHFSQLGGQEYTQPGMFIANLLDDPSMVMPVT